MKKTIIKLETLKYARITALMLGGISVFSILLIVKVIVYKINKPALEINYTMWGFIFFIIYIGLIYFFQKTRKEIRSIDNDHFIIFSQFGFVKTNKTTYLKEEIDTIQISQNSRKYYVAQLLLKNGSIVLLDKFTNKKQAETLVTSIKQNIV